MTPRGADFSTSAAFAVQYNTAHDRTHWNYKYMATTAHWEHFPHQADIGVRGYGATPAEAFEQVALALTAVVTYPDFVATNQRIEVTCEAPDIELLLVEWLDQLVYLMATRSLLFSRFKVHIAGNRLAAQAWGEAIDVARHRPAVEVKGATFTELKVVQQDGGWMAQCVVDV